MNRANKRMLKPICGVKVKRLFHKMIIEYRIKMTVLLFFLSKSILFCGMHINNNINVKNKFIIGLISQKGHGSSDKYIKEK